MEIAIFESAKASVKPRVASYQELWLELTGLDPLAATAQELAEIASSIKEIGVEANLEW